MISKWAMLLVLLFVFANEDATSEEVPEEYCNAFETVLDRAESRLKAVEEHLEYRSKHGFQLAQPSRIVEVGETMKHNVQFTSVDVISRRTPKTTENKKKVQLHGWQRRQLAHFIVTMDEDKNIQIWSERQELLHEIRSGLKGKVTARATLSMPNNMYYLVGTDLGEVKLFEIQAWRPFQNGKLYDLIEAKITESNELVVPKKAFGPDYTTSKEKGGEEEEGASEEETEDDNSFVYPGVRFLGIYRKKSNRKFLVVYDNNQIHLFDKMTKWRKRYQHDEEITGLYIGSATISLISTSLGWNLIRTIKLKPLGGLCEQEGAITHAEFDMKFNHMLYISKANGTVLVHHTKKLGSKKKRHCRVARRYEFGLGPPVSVKSLDGYFFTVLPRHLILHNVSGLIWTARGLEYMQPLEEGSLVGVSQFESRKSQMVAIVHEKSMTTLHTFLPTIEETKGGMFKNFSRIPMVFGVMIFFLGYQYFSGGSNPFSALTGMGRRGRDSGRHGRLGFNQHGRRSGRVGGMHNAFGGRHAGRHGSSAKGRRMPFSR